MQAISALEVEDDERLQAGSSVHAKANLVANKRLCTSCIELEIDLDDEPITLFPNSDCMNGKDISMQGQSMLLLDSAEFEIALPDSFGDACVESSDETGQDVSINRKKNVVIPINGRLGNQLFQLAASVSIKPHVRNLYWIENLYDEDTDYRAELFPPTLHSVHSEENLPCTPTKEYKVDYNCSNLLRQSDWPWYATCFKMIQPYFQCHELAARGLPLVVSSLLKQTYRLNTARQFMARNFWNEELIAIHVRRGDYLKSFNRRLLEPLSVSYYSAALSAHFRPNCSVLVFSDEIPWCKTVFTYSADLPFHFKFMDVRDPILALFIMASADHHIIANSTFSWWAAFLHDSLVALIRPLHKIRKHAVIAPNPWFGRRMMKKHIDLIPHHWIQFNVTSETTITSNKT